MRKERLPIQFYVTERRRRDKEELWAFAYDEVSDVCPTARSDVLNARCVHHSPSRTAQTRTGSPTPFSACSPLSSNETPAEVRARSRTVCETSTSPGGDSPLMREATFTAPP